MKFLFRSGHILGEVPELGVTVIGADEVSMADQSFREECDINTIVKRFGITGVVGGPQLPPPIEDFADIFDFQTAMNVLNAADRAFMSLDAEVRARFGNDAGRYVDFCSKRNPDGSLVNLDEMRKLGLALAAPPAPVVPPPVRVEVVNAPAKPA